MQLSLDIPRLRLTPFGWSEVVSLSSDGIEKRLHVDSGHVVSVHALACVGKGDLIRRHATGVVEVKVADATLPISPPFRIDLRHQVTPTNILPLTAHELVTQADFDSYHALAQFHYRSERSFGRRAVLLLECHDPAFPSAVAFVEVTTPFLHLRNRNALLDAPFTEPGFGVSWATWDLPARNRYVNAIIRISRVVVHPELRGLGLSRPLIDAAAAYARERWHVRDLRPLFLEITADMLKFMPFVASGGMEYIGESEGNADRLAKDMSYLSRAQLADKEGHAVLSGRGKGILRRQKRDIELVTRLRDSMAPGETVPEFIGRLLSSGDVDERSSELLMPLLRHPKPTYMKGLTRTSAGFLSRRVRDLGLIQPKLPVTEPKPFVGPLKVDDLTLNYEIDTGSLRGTATGTVRRAFGLDREFSFRTGITNLSFRAEAGQVIYLYGASGSGKTSLLGLIGASGAASRPETRVSGSLHLPSGAAIGRLEAPDTGGPLMSTIGAASLGDAIYALNAAGLSEPRLYLSDYAALSAGQQYRASLARLICSDANLWLLDEFAAGLDDATAMAVGRNFAKAARRAGVILVVATVRRQPLVSAMEPDVVVQLTQLESPVVSSDWAAWVGGSR